MGERRWARRRRERLVRREPPDVVAAGEPSGSGRPADEPVGPVRPAGPETRSPVDRLVATVVDGPGVTEILINGPGPVWIERRGALVPTGLHLDRHAIDLLIEAILGPLGLRVDRTSPIVDARLPDGSRVNIVVPPLAIDGPAISIRRFPEVVVPLSRFGPPDLGRLLAGLVAARASMLVVGPTSSGKTSLVAALAASIDPAERLVCIEDTAELTLRHPNLVRLEARPANSEGVGEVTLRRLVLTALRMRPDRLVIGEVRGAEAFDLLLALTSGHRGGLTTCHAADAAGGLRRLATLAGLADSGLPAARLEDLVADAIDVVVVTGRRGGVRSVVEVARVDPTGPSTLWSTAGPVDGRRQPIAEPPGDASGGRSDRETAAVPRRREAA